MKQYLNAEAKKTENRFIMLILLSMTNFMGFYKIVPILGKLYSVDFSYLFVAVFSMFYLLKGIRHNNGKIRLGTYKSFVLIYLLFVIIEFVISFCAYKQPISLIFKETIYYIIPIISYLAYMQLKKSDNEIIFDLIVKFSVICSVIAILCFILYTLWGYNPLKISDQSIINFRNGTVRFSIGQFVVIMGVLVSSCRVLLRHASKIDYYNLLLSSYHLVFIGKTRTVILYIIVSIILLIILHKKMNFLLRFVLILLSICILIYIFFIYENLSDNINSFIASDGGILVRFEAIDFYIKQFVHKPMFGMGFLSTSKDVAGWELLYGPNGNFYREDVGVVGLVNKFGIIGLGLCISFLIKTYRKLKLFPKIMNYEYTIIFCFLLYLIITLINLSFFDFNRTMYLFFMMIFIENCLRRFKYEK